MSKKYLLIPLFIMAILLSGCSYIKDYQNKDYKSVSDLNDSFNITTLNDTPNELDTSEFDLLLPYYGDLTFYFLNVPSRPIFVLFPNNETMLINTGTDKEPNRIYNYVKNLGFKTVDYVILSNYNSYRLGGAPYLNIKLQPGNTYDRGGALTTKIFEEYENSLVNRKSFGNEYSEEIDGVDFIIYPTFTRFNKNEDMNTLVYKFEYGSFSLLHMGDCIGTCEDMLEDYDLKSDVLVAAKNGDCDGTSTYLLQKINPKLVIFDNSFGEPCPEVIARLNHFDIDYKKLSGDNNYYIRTDGTIY